MATEFGSIHEYHCNGGFGAILGDSGEMFFFRAENLSKHLRELADSGQLNQGHRVEFRPRNYRPDGGQNRRVFGIMDLPFETKMSVPAFGYVLDVFVGGDDVPAEVIGRCVQEIRQTWSGYNRMITDCAYHHLPMPKGMLKHDSPLAVTYVTGEGVYQFRVNAVRDWDTEVRITVRKTTLRHRIQRALREKLGAPDMFGTSDGVEYTEGYSYVLTRWPVSQSGLRARWYWHARIVGDGSFLEDAKTDDERELTPEERREAFEVLQHSVEEKDGVWGFRYPRSEIVHFTAVEPDPAKRYDGATYNVVVADWGPNVVETSLSLERGNALARYHATQSPNKWVFLSDAGHPRHLPTENPNAWMHSPKDKRGYPAVK